MAKKATSGEWRIVPDGNDFEICGPDGYLWAVAYSRARAEEIVRAVNAHETLVTTLQRCRKGLENLRDYGADAADIAAELGIIDAALVLASKESK